MPSAFIREQAELLRRCRDPELVLNNMRAKYAVSSFPSQMTRLKEQWYQFNERHESFSHEFNAGLRSLKAQRIAPKFTDKYVEFGKGSIKTQLQHQKVAAKGDYSGSKRTDAVITALRVLPDYMSRYRLTKDDKQRSSDLATQSIETRSMNCINVRDADALLRRCRTIVTALTEDPFIITAAIGVLCGRRSCEILCTGVFEASSRGSFACLFHGAAKKRTTHRAEHIPLLCKFKYLSRAIDHIRAEIRACGITNSQMNARYSHKLGDSAKILMESVDTKFHDLRAIYAMVTHNLFENDCSVNIWLKKTLLHDAIETSVHYSRCKVSNFPDKLGKWSF